MDMNSILGASAVALLYTVLYASDYEKHQLPICPYSFLEGAKTKSKNFETFLMLPMSNFIPRYKKYLFSGRLHFLNTVLVEFSCVSWYSNLKECT